MEKEVGLTCEVLFFILWFTEEGSVDSMPVP